MYQNNERDLNTDERKVADKVADEILIKEKEQNVFIWLFLLIFVLLLTFFSFLVFSKIAYNGNTTENYIDSGSVLFSYEEGINSINITGALPTSDEVGKAMSGTNEYFKFGVAVNLQSTTQTEITYEISLTPKTGSLDTKYVRVYLVKDNNEVKINDKTVNTYFDLPNSTLREGSKLLYTEKVSQKTTHSYVFKMWLSDEYLLKYDAETFSCYVNVDAY